MVRVINGDVVPYEKYIPPIAGDTAVVIQDVGLRTITLQYDDSLAAGAFRFSGEVIPDQTHIGELQIIPGFGSDLQGRVLIDPLSNAMGLFGQGMLFSYSGDAFLVHAEFADYFDNEIPVRLERINISRMCGDVNDDENINLIDMTYIVNYIFFPGPMPDPYAAADVNMDGRVNLVDVVYLLTYLFRYDPEPGAGL